MRNPPNTQTRRTAILWRAARPRIATAVVAKRSTGAASARHGDRTNNGGADTLGEAKAAWLYALQGPNRRGRKSVESWRIRPERLSLDSERESAMQNEIYSIYHLSIAPADFDAFEELIQRIVGRRAKRRTRRSMNMSSIPIELRCISSSGIAPRGCCRISSRHSPPSLSAF